jgi:hypothetical protein
MSLRSRTRRALRIRPGRRASTLIWLAAGVTLLAATPASAAGSFGVGTGRVVPSVAVVVGLIGMVVGTRTLARRADPVGRDARRRGALVAAAAGAVSAVVGGLHAASAAGGVGTGNGLAGAIVAMVVGLISVILGGLALARARRTA